MIDFDKPHAWREDLQTDAISLSYFFPERLGLILLPEGCCVDMSGAIALFTAIDPNVLQIETLAKGQKLPTQYWRPGVGDEWIVVP